MQDLRSADADCHRVFQQNRLRADIRRAPLTGLTSPSGGDVSGRKRCDGRSRLRPVVAPTQEGALYRVVKSRTENHHSQGVNGKQHQPLHPSRQHRHQHFVHQMHGNLVAQVCECLSLHPGLRAAVRRFTGERCRGETPSHPGHRLTAECPHHGRCHSGACMSGSVDGRLAYGIRTSEPVLAREAMSWWALLASRSGYFVMATSPRTPAFKAAKTSLVACWTWPAR